MKIYGEEYICFIRDEWMNDGRISIVFLRFDETFCQHFDRLPLLEMFEIANIFRAPFFLIFYQSITIYCILFPRWLLFDDLSRSLRYNLALPDRTSSRTVRISRGRPIKNPVSVKIVKHIPREASITVISRQGNCLRERVGYTSRMEERKEEHDSSITPPRVS